MIDIFLYYAKCNAIINSDMISVIELNIENPYELQLSGYYFKTLGQLLEHIYISDMNWMNTFLAVKKYKTKLGRIPKYNEKLFNNFIDFKIARQNLDIIIINFMKETEEKDLNKIVSKINSKNEKLEKMSWKCLMHFFNHQTHHRGQISQILDNLKIENNYSNMVFID